MAKQKDHNGRRQQSQRDAGLRPTGVETAPAEVAEEKTAERPGDKARREGEKRQDLPQERIDFGEEQARKDESGHLAIEEEIVPFDRGTDRAGYHRLDQGTPSDRCIRLCRSL